MAMDEIAHRELFGIAECERRKVVGIDLEQSDVGLRIAADQFGAELATILKGDRDLVRIIDDVVVL